MSRVWSPFHYFPPSSSSRPSAQRGRSLSQCLRALGFLPGASALRASLAEQCTAPRVTLPLPHVSGCFRVSLRPLPSDCGFPGALGLVSRWLCFPALLLGDPGGHRCDWETGVVRARPSVPAPSLPGHPLCQARVPDPSRPLSPCVGVCVSEEVAPLPTSWDDFGKGSLPPVARGTGGQVVALNQWRRACGSTASQGVMSLWFSPLASTTATAAHPQQACGGPRWLQGLWLLSRVSGSRSWGPGTAAGVAGAQLWGQLQGPRLWSLLACRHSRGAGVRAGGQGHFGPLGKVEVLGVCHGLCASHPAGQ